jgi:hypothetical protein
MITESISFFLLAQLMTIGTVYAHKPGTCSMAGLNSLGLNASRLLYWKVNTVQFTNGTAFTS